MPIIEIANKICSHCNGTRWYTRTTKDGVLIQICSVKKNEYNKKWRVRFPEKAKAISTRSIDKVKDTEKYKTKNLIRAAKYFEKNREKVRLQSANTYSKYKEKYKEKYGERIKKKTKFYSENLTNNYVVGLIRGETRGLKYSDVPQELIELKRKQLILTRTIRNHGK